MAKNPRKSLLASTTVAAALLLGGDAAVTAAPPAATPPGQQQSGDADSSNCRVVKVQPDKEAAMTFGNETQRFRVCWPDSENWRVASMTSVPAGKLDEDAASGAAGLQLDTASQAVTISALEAGLYTLTFVREADGKTFTLQLSRPARWFDEDHGYTPGTRYGVAHLRS